MTAARTLALEALRQLDSSLQFTDWENGEGEEIGAQLRAAAAALEAETGEVAAWIGHSQVTGLQFAAMPDEHRSEACAPWIPTYIAQPSAVPQGRQLLTICMLKQVTEALAARLGTNADEWPLVLSARNLIEDFE